MNLLPLDLESQAVRGAGVPPDAIVYVGGTDHAHSRYFFEKNKRRYLIVAPSRWAASDYDLLSEEENIERMRDFKPMLQIIVESIQGLETFTSLKLRTYQRDLLPSFDFERSNIGYIVSKKGGTVHLAQRYRPLKRVTCPTWAPLVTLGDLTFSRFFGATWNRRGAVYQGCKVDVFIASDDHDVDRLDHIMQMHLLLADLDVTYRVVAHLVDEDSSVYGLITEPHLGREVTYRDKTLLYDAVSRLQSKRLIHTNLVDSSFIHVRNGKIRFAELLAIRHISDEADLQKFHWDDLGSCLFHRLFHSQLSKSTRGWPYSEPNATWLLLYQPHPHRLLLPSMLCDQASIRGRRRDGHPSRDKKLGRKNVQGLEFGLAGPLKRQCPTRLPLKGKGRQHTSTISMTANGKSEPVIVSHRDGETSLRTEVGASVGQLVGCGCTFSINELG